jgi:hypothetical protein
MANQVISITPVFAAHACNSWIVVGWHDREKITSSWDRTGSSWLWQRQDIRREGCRIGRDAKLL